MNRRTLKDTMHIEFNGKEIPVFGFEGLEKVDIENIIQSGINEKVLEGILCRSCNLMELTELLVTEDCVYVKCIGVPLKKVIEQDNMGDRTVTIIYENGREVKYKRTDAMFNDKLFYSLKDLGEELKRRADNHDRLWDGVKIEGEEKRREPEVDIPLEENEMPKRVVKYSGGNTHVLIETIKDIHIEWIGENRELRTKHGFVKLKDGQYIVQHQDKTIEVFEEEEFNECYCEHTKWNFLEDGRAHSAVNPQGIHVFGGVIGINDVIKFEEELKGRKSMTKEQSKILPASDVIEEINNSPVEMGTGMKIDLGGIALRNNDKLNGGADTPKTYLGIGGSIYSNKFDEKTLKTNWAPYRILPGGNELEGYKIFDENKNKVVATVYVKTMAMRMVGELNKEAANKFKEGVAVIKSTITEAAEKIESKVCSSTEESSIVQTSDGSVHLKLKRKPIRSFKIKEEVYKSLSVEGIHLLFNEKLKVGCSGISEGTVLPVKHIAHTVTTDEYLIDCVLPNLMRLKLQVIVRRETTGDDALYSVEFYDVKDTGYIFGEV